MQNAGGILRSQFKNWLQPYEFALGANSAIEFYIVRRTTREGGVSFGGQDSNPFKCRMPVGKLETNLGQITAINNSQTILKHLSNLPQLCYNTIKRMRGKGGGRDEMEAGLRKIAVPRLGICFAVCVGGSGRAHLCLFRKQAGELGGIPDLCWPWRRRCWSSSGRLTASTSAPL